MREAGMGPGMADEDQRCSERSRAIAGFLRDCGWAGARLAPLAGDASNRRYLRLRQGDARAVLMDAPAALGEDVRPFLAIALHLAGQGLSAPAVIAADPGQGLVLMEDLGDDLFARAIPAGRGDEATLYRAATDVLAHLHRHPLPEGLPEWGPGTPGALAALALEWYLPQPAGPDAGAELAALVDALWAQHAAGPRVLVLRDYHAENLLWLPGRSGVARVGLLDFQDAVPGHPAYDLVSLVGDARRDVPADLAAAMISRLAAAGGHDPEAFATACACLGAQRNLRILGVFARLCLRDGKPGYLRFLPRVWAHLQRDLSHPSLAGLQGMLRSLPEPDTAHVSALAARVGSMAASDASHRGGAVSGGSLAGAELHGQAVRPEALPLMIMAAGLGRRMRPLTDDRPKPLVPVAGRPLIDHALDLALGAGAAPVVVNTHYHGHMLAAHLARRADMQPVLRLSPEPRLLDTGGGLRAALPLLRADGAAGPVMTLNSDYVWTGPNPLRLLIRQWHGAAPGAEALLLLVPVARARGYRGSGDFALLPDGRLARGGPLAYAGAQILLPGAVAAEADPVFSLNRVWDGMLARGTLYGLLHAGGWCEVGDPDAIPEAEAMLKAPA